MKLIVKGIYASGVMLGGLLLSVTACDLSGLTGKQQLPSGIQDPGVYRTAEGALKLYQGAVYSFQVSPAESGSRDRSPLLDAMLYGGLLTDELQPSDILGSTTPQPAYDYAIIDARLRDKGKTSSDVYNELQLVRGNATLAMGALAAYDTSAPPALRGHLQAMMGYAEVLLADIFCSGVPLSTIDFDKNFTYHASSTTTQLYQSAIAHFDTALTVSHDSVRIENLAWVGKARAYLDLGQYDSAAAAAAHVPTDFVYQFPVRWAYGFNDRLFSYSSRPTLSDREGINGLPYRSSGDPRSASEPGDSTVTVPLPHHTNNYGAVLYYPLKYGGDSSLSSPRPFTVADGIEARLIQAEAAYHGVVTGSGSWLDQLNALRATIGLPALSDPGTANGQVDLIFQERAYWMYLTGHRLGDLRREVRNYHRNAETVFPTGRYLNGATVITSYGIEVAAPIPYAEHINPYFHGCLSTDA